MEWTWPLWAQKLLAALGRSVRTAVKVAEVVEDHPQLRADLEAHKDEDRERHGEILLKIEQMHGDVKATRTDVEWLKRAPKE
jgi:hypothetical protein